MTLTVVVAVLWVALWGQVTVANVLGGLAVGAGITLAERRRRVARPMQVDAPPTHRAVFRPLAAVRLAADVVRRLVIANARVAWEVITPTDHTAEGVVTLPLGRAPDQLVAVVAGAVTLTPGTLVLRADRAADGAVVLSVHVLHLRDPDAVHRDLDALIRVAAAAVAPDVLGDLDPPAAANRAEAGARDRQVT
jgi:multicomponent Na+:H+ antiporter subunit E